MPEQRSTWLSSKDYIIGVLDVLTSNKGVNWFCYYFQTEKQPYISVSSFDTRVMMVMTVMMDRYVKTKAVLELTVNETAPWPRRFFVSLSTIPNRSIATDVTGVTWLQRINSYVLDPVGIAKRCVLYSQTSGKTERRDCSKCQICAHVYSWTCIDYQLKLNICKHIHLTIRYFEEKVNKIWTLFRNTNTVMK